MKNKNMIFILVVLATMFMISCDNNTTSSQNPQYNDFSDITIPDNFNFETNRVLDLEFIAPNKGTVVVVGDDGVEYYRFLTNDSETIERTISIPRTVETLDFHFRNMVFADYSVDSLINNPEIYLLNIEEIDDIEGKSDKVVKLFVIPILEGIILENDGSITSHWGYNNQFAETYTQAIGAKNKFTGSGLNNSNQDQGQPTEFLPGRHYDVFTVNFTSIGNDCITWSLQSSSRLTQDACPDAPLFPGSDQDSDGVEDDDDDYPNDPDRAYDYFYPSEGNYGTLAYEDLWPNKGDYDFNDMVIRYNIKEVVAASDALMEIHFDLLLTAVGASKQNGFYFELPHPATDVEVIQASHPGLTVKTNSSGLAIIQVFNNTNDIIQLNGEFMNTVQTNPHTDYIPISFVLAIDDKYDNHTSIYYPPYNAFVTVDHDISKEVHLPGLPPTPNADISLFNNGYDDATDLDADYFYKTAEGAPWAVNIPYPIAHPTETTDIVVAYPEFGQWVTSGGTAFEDWYENPDLEYVYQEPTD